MYFKRIGPPSNECVLRAFLSEITAVKMPHQKQARQSLFQAGVVRCFRLSRSIKSAKKITLVIVAAHWRAQRLALLHPVFSYFRIFSGRSL